MKLFIIYGMITDERFYERAEKFTLLKNTEGKYFTFDEYKTLVEPEQTDKNKNLIYLYTSDAESQYSYVQAARNKGYDVLVLDGHLDMHFINFLESKNQNTRFVRVDADTAENLILKEREETSKLGELEKQRVRLMFEGILPEEDRYIVGMENMQETDMPVLLTRDEFMRRMKDMSAVGGGANFYGDLPNNFRLIVNSNHPLIVDLSTKAEKDLGNELQEISKEIEPAKKEMEELNKSHENKKDEEIPSAEKERKEDLQKEIDKLSETRSELLKDYGKNTKIVSQLFDLALLSNNMLKGEALNQFVSRSLDLLK